MTTEIALSNPTKRELPTSRHDLTLSRPVNESDSQDLLDPQALIDGPGIGGLQLNGRTSMSTTHLTGGNADREGVATKNSETTSHSLKVDTNSSLIGSNEMALSEEQVLSPGLDVDLEEYYDYDVNVEVRYLISARHAGGLIGKKGAYINQIRQKADVEFLVHKAVPNTPLRTGSVRGSVRNVVHALLLMADKISELQKASRRISRSDYLFQFGDYSVTLLLEHKNCGVIIGKRGARISCNRQRSGAHIKISTHVLENSSEKTVDIQGRREAVENALETLVVQIANNPKPNVTNRKYLDQSSHFTKRQPHLRYPHTHLSSHQHQPHRSQQPQQQPFYNPMSYLGYHYTTPSNNGYQNWNQQSFYQTRI